MSRTDILVTIVAILVYTIYVAATSFTRGESTAAVSLGALLLLNVLRR